MGVSRAVLPFSASRGPGRVLLSLFGAVAICVVLDVGLLTWIRVGPPAGKGEIFFVELVIMVAAALVVSASAIMAPEVARNIAPFLFIVLAWHTGFQVPLDKTGEFVITVFDVLVPLSLFLGLVGRWYVTGTTVKSWFQEHWRLMAIFWAFCFWGLILAVVRNIDPAPMLANLKSMLFYPLILIILPWCIRSWKQLYWALALLVALVFERALDGLDQAVNHQVSKFVTELAHGHLIYRIDGHMAATNQYAAYLMSGGLILLAIASASQVRRAWRLAMLAPLALIALALLLTYSRGAWLGTGIGLVAMLLMLNPKRALGAVGVLAFLAFVVEIVHPGAGTQILLRANDYDHSIAARQNFENIGVQVIQHFPLGAGWGAWFQLIPGGLNAIPGFPWYHDDYLQLATEIGVPGLLSMLAILGSVAMMGWHTARSTVDPNKAAAVAGITAAFTALLVQTATDQFLWHADIAPHIWIIAGLLAGAVVMVKSDVLRQKTIDNALEYAEITAPEREPALA